MANKNVEAIEVIETYKRDYSYPGTHCDRMLKLAIEALESMQELEELREKQKKCECKDLREALIYMVGQFAYGGKKKYGQDTVCTGGMSALEIAFDVLGIKENTTHKKLWSLMEDGE